MLQNSTAIFWLDTKPFLLDLFFASTAMFPALVMYYFYYTCMLVVPLNLRKAFRVH
jgi:hypothetical protein